MGWKRSITWDHLLDSEVQGLELLAFVKFRDMCASSLVQHSQSACNSFADDFAVMEWEDQRQERGEKDRACDEKVPTVKTEQWKQVLINVFSSMYKFKYILAILAAAPELFWATRSCCSSALASSNDLRMSALDFLRSSCALMGAYKVKSIRLSSSLDSDKNLSCEICGKKHIKIVVDGTDGRPHKDGHINSSANFHMHIIKIRLLQDIPQKWLKELNLTKTIINPLKVSIFMLHHKQLRMFCQYRYHLSW